MKTIFLMISLFSVTFLFCQKIDMQKIKEQVTLKSSPFFYEKLIEEFKNKPSLIRADDAKKEYLYYGKLYSGYYRKNSEAKRDYLKFIKWTGSGKYAKAIPLGEELVKEDPVNLTLLINLMTCYKNNEVKNEERSRQLELQVEILLSTLANHGDGKSKETAFKVVSLSDEFILLHYLGINLKKYTRSSEYLTENTILDVWSKEDTYKEDHRNNIYVLVYSATTKNK